MNPIIRHMLAVDAEREQAAVLVYLMDGASGGLPHTAEKLRCIEDGVVTKLAACWTFEIINVLKDRPLSGNLDMISGVML